MKITVWKKNEAIVYVGGDPNKGEPPILTLTLKEPQIQIDEDTNTIVVKETK